MKAYLTSSLHADIMQNGTIIDEGKILADGAYTSDFDHILTPIEGDCNATEEQIASFNKKQRSKRSSSIGKQHLNTP